MTIWCCPCSSCNKLVWVAFELCVNTTWAQSCKLHVPDIKSSVTKISSIKREFKFYKSIKTEGVCVFACTRSPYGFTTTPPKSSILLSGTELVSLWYRYCSMCASVSVQNWKHWNKSRSLFRVCGKRVLDWRINFLKVFFLSLWCRTYVVLVWVKNCW